MRTMTLTMRTAALGAAIAAVALLLFATGERASAAGTLDPTGVYCIDGYIDGDQDTPKGNAPNVDTNNGNGDDVRSVKYLVRIEPSTVYPGDYSVTVVAYQGPGSPIPSKPPSAAVCSAEGNGNSLNGSITSFQTISGGTRPTAIGTESVKATPVPSTENFEWEICQENGFGDLWVLTRYSLVVTGDKDMDGAFGQQTAFLDADACTDVSPDLEFDLVLVADKRAAPAAFSDWDGGGRSDWDELTPAQRRGDPFRAVDDASGGVGGVAELPDDVATAPVAATESSSSNTSLIIALASGAALAVMATGGAFVLKRRSVR